MKWRIECKHSGSGKDFEGTLDEALEVARRQCSADWSRYVLWALPANIRMAEVVQTGPLWVKQKLTGDEVVKLMRRYKKRIAELAFAMGITQKRIRQVRFHGLDDPYAVRDWLEAIASEDMGPLPMKYRIRRDCEEATCDYCGFPLYVGDTAFEYAYSVYCSVTCARKLREHSKEVNS